MVAILSIPIIKGDIEDNRCISGGVSFSNLDHWTDGILKTSSPDKYYGACSEQLNRRVRSELSGHIAPSIRDDLPIVPNYLLESKLTRGSPAVAMRQDSWQAVETSSWEVLHTTKMLHLGQRKRETRQSSRRTSKLMIMSSHQVPMQVSNKPKASQVQ